MSQIFYDFCIYVDMINFIYSFSLTILLEISAYSKIGIPSKYRHSNYLLFGKLIFKVFITYQVDKKYCWILLSKIIGKLLFIFQIKEIYRLSSVEKDHTNLWLNHMKLRNKIVLNNKNS